jgi:5-hydroxyisourate hydrolase
MGLSTHILDNAKGRPAADVSLSLAKLSNGAWSEAGSGTTDADGRCKTLLGDAALEQATYKIRFDTAAYYKAEGLAGLYPYVEIVFDVTDAAVHYHIPLLLTANSYSTYRGS